MALLMTFVVVALVADTLFTEVQKFTNILEALSTGFVKFDYKKNKKADVINWKEAYAAR